MQLVDYTPVHIEQMQLRAHEQSLGAALTDCAGSVKGPAYTLKTDSGEIVGCAGVEIWWNGVGEAWAILGPLAYSYPVALHKSVLTMLEAIEKKHRLHRVQACVMAGFSAGDKWIKALGFSHEGRMRQYGPGGEDFNRYARTKIWQQQPH